MSGYYPVVLDLRQKTCLVVGGGKVAERKAGSLLRAGAVVRLISPGVTPGLEKMARAGSLDWIRKSYQAGDASGVFLAIAATGDRMVNQQVALECRAEKILVCVADDPDMSDFFVPAVVNREALTIAVSTGGNSPVLARRIKERLEKMFPPGIEEFIIFLGEVRKNIMGAEKTGCRQLLEQIVDETTLKLLETGDFAGARERVCHVYNNCRG